MPLPAAPTGTINDLIPGVQAALQNRGDVSEAQSNPAMRPSRWIKRAIQEFTESQPFEELRTTGPTVTLTALQAFYPVTFFLNQGDDYTFPESLAIFIDFPTNTIKQTLDYKTPKAMEQMTSNTTIGLPSRWTRYGQQIFIGPNPNQPYSMFMRYQIRHPFNDANLPTSSLYIPDTWHEIVEMAAAEKGAIANRWNDQATYLHNALWGDPEYQMTEGKRGRPGMVAARILQPERDQSFNSRALTVLVSRYNPR